MAKDSKSKKSGVTGNNFAPRKRKKVTCQGNSKFSRPKKGRKAYRGQGR